MTATMQAIPARRPRYYGVWQILRFNWPFYAAGTVLCVLGVVALSTLSLPRWLAGCGWLVLVAVAWWEIASLLVSYLVYDASPLYQWQWLRTLLPTAPRRWANIHSGLDESSPSLREMFGGEAVTVDIYNRLEMTEPAIARARLLTTPPVGAVSADYRSLPFADSALDAVFLLFAAHEIRSAESRLRFWLEVSRVLRPGGAVIVVEHQRDVLNFIAFGPGFWHFLSRREWLRLFRAAGLSVEQELKMTPFVRAFSLRRSTP